MKNIIINARFILCWLIIAGFFLPTYENVSGLTFIPMAFAYLDGQNEIEAIDVYIAVFPLIIVPVSAIAILLATYLRRPIRKTFKALPLICLFTFTIVLFMSLRNIAGGGRSSLRILANLGVVFYIVGIAAVLLPFTKNPYLLKAKERKAAAKEETAEML